MNNLLRALAIVVIGASPALAVPKSTQSSARPMGLSIFGPVHNSGSDSRSEDFNDELLTNALALVEVNLDEGVEFVARGVTRLDPERLFLFHNSDRPLRIYFLNEGAGYRNTLGVSTSLAGSETEGTRKILIPDVSDGTWGGPELLAPGDWVEFGNFPAGTQFEFFIIRDAINGGSDVFTNKDDRNPDDLQHMVAWLLGERYVLIGFEDLMNGGDLDYNDVVFVADLGPDLGTSFTSLPK